MSRLQAVTRRAAWAVFLLFAAVLLVVAPAEASLPRSAGVTQVDAVALASLERPALGLASPALEPSGFSLGEDLGVLDTAGAPGSLGLCGLETRRCALAYARNNPINRIDPDGRDDELAADFMMREQVRDRGGDAAVARMDQQRAVVGGAIIGGLVLGSQAPALLSWFLTPQGNQQAQTLLEGIAGPPGPSQTPTAGLNQVGRFTLTKTVANHADEIVTKGPFKGELARPFLKSALTIEEITKAAPGVADPGGVKGALRWDVKGVFRGTEGTWELVMKDNVVLHLNFVAK